MISDKDQRIKKEKLSNLLVSLTKRETEVLLAMSKGMTDKEIARHLSISKYTVSDHRQKMQKKFNARNSCELMFLACRQGLV